MTEEEIKKDMTTSFNMENLFSSCVLLSRTEGREQKDAQGESLYERIKMQDRDKVPVLQHLFEAALDVNKYLVPFAEPSLSIILLSWEWKDSYDVPDGVGSLIERYLINWAMAAWLSDKTQERSHYYTELCPKLLNGIISMIHRKKPTL